MCTCVPMYSTCVYMCSYVQYMCTCVPMYSTCVHMLLLSQEPVDWVEGDNIVIAPTSKDGNETEVSDMCTC